MSELSNFKGCTVLIRDESDRLVANVEILGHDLSENCIELKDLPVLQEVVKGAWRKENELKELKSELAALDRKIQLSLKPIEGGALSNGQSAPLGEPNRELSVYTPSLDKTASQDSTSKKPELPKELERIREAMGGRVVVASPVRSGVKL